MSRRTYCTITPGQVEDLAVAMLKPTLDLQDHGPKCTVSTILRVLLFAAARITSIADACARLARAPSDQAVYNALEAWMPPMGQLEQRLTGSLQVKLPKSLWRKARPLVIDLKQIPYYGQPVDGRQLRRGKRQAGTSRFHCYATLYVARKGERFSLAMTYVWKDDSYQAVVQRLLEQARKLGIRCRYLMLDRAFYSVAVIAYLQRIRCPFIMPVVHRGRTPRSDRPLTGTRRFLRYKRSGWASHQMSNHGQTVRFGIAVCCQGSRSSRKRRRDGPTVFAVWRLPACAPGWVAERYRKRFGIESSYRQLDAIRVRTCSRDVRLRLLLVGLALVLRNLWVWLHRMVLGRLRGRGLEMHLERLRLRTLLLMLQRVAEAYLGCRESVHPPPVNTLTAAA